MGALIVLGGAGLIVLFLFILSLRSLIFTCAPNEVLIFSGPKRREGDRLLRYKLIKGGTKLRVPLLERVDRMDLTNMVIDLTAQGAYCKGGVPLNVQGVANLKVAGHEPVLNNAIERFLGKGRNEIMEIAKATLEGSLRGVLATLTPEQVNEDRTLFAEQLVNEVEQDMTALGLVADTLKIQNVSDDVGYLDSIGRKRNAELFSSARIAEAIARADSIVNQAQNLEREVTAQITAQTNVSRAEADQKVADIVTRRAALVAEENAIVTAAIAQATAEIEVQKARIDQVRGRLNADLVEPAKAACEAAETQAIASVAPIIEQGKARADALRTLSASWKDAGPQAKDIFLMQKLQPIIRQLTQVIAHTQVEKLTMIDSAAASDGPAKWLPLLEQIKQIYGIDLVETTKELAAKRGALRTKELPSDSANDESVSDPEPTSN